jgi:transposase
VKDVHDWININRLHKKGVKIKQIARQLKISKNTVKRLLGKKDEPKYKRSVYKTKIDSYKEQVKVWFVENDFIATRIFNELQTIGYKGSINPLYRYLKTLKSKKDEISKKATDRIETPPGEQAQFDWSPYIMVIDNELIKVICFSMILSHSRYKSLVLHPNNVSIILIPY